jgi:hypothetical protein
MAYIDKGNNVTINTKLTAIGRKLLASGSLNFSYYTVGDSEINYMAIDDTDFDGMNSQILRPKDKYPDVVSYLPQTPTADKFISMGSGNINVAELMVINSADPRGFFTFTTNGSQSGFTLNSSPTYFNGRTTYNTADADGTNLLPVSDISYFAVGNYALIQWLSPSATAGLDMNADIISAATPFLWYKVEAIVGSSIQLDRNVPNFSNDPAGFGYVYSFPGGDSINEYYGSGMTTTDFWNPNTLAFDSSCMLSENVPVLNCNIIYLETMEGTDTTVFEGYGDYGSFSYYGLETYLSVLRRNPLQKGIGVVHYSNNALTNIYGETLYGATVRIDLPTIMSHKTSDHIGLTLVSDSVKKTQITDNSGSTVLLTTTYYDLLVNNPNSGINAVVGKVFNDLKIVVVEDPELLAAMSYKSNRNWTYPALLSSVSPKFSTETQLFSNTNEVLYVTYLLENTLPYNAGNSFGYGTALHCQERAVINGSNGVNNSAVVYVDYSNLKYYKDSTGIAGGEGYTASALKLIMQKVTNGTKPDPTAWKVIDVTSLLPNYGVWGGSCIPYSALLNQPIRIDGALYASATTYSINDYLDIPQLNDTDKLQFGDEVFLFGTFNTDIAAIVYRTKFNFVLSNGMFNTSTNSTWSTTDNTYISEVAMYDVNKNLVAIGKISYPIKKNSGKTVIIEVDLDF